MLQLLTEIFGYGTPFSPCGPSYGGYSKSLTPALVVLSHTAYTDIASPGENGSSNVGSHG